MSDLALFAIALTFPFWAILVWRNDGFLKSCLVVTCLLIFGSGFAQTLTPVRFSLAICAILIVVSVGIGDRAHVDQKTMRLCLFGIFMCGLTFMFFQFFVEATELDRLFRYIVLYPFLLAAGVILAASNKGILVAKTYLYCSLFFGICAVAERIRGTFFMADAYANVDRLMRDGTIRSIVAAEHPLVLSVLLVAAIPFVQLATNNRTLRILAYFILLGGIFSTNSRGALALVVVWFVLSAALKTPALGRMGTKALRSIAALIAGAGLVWLLSGTGSESLSSTSAVEASAEYRTSLYTFAARSLTDQPFGWGVAGLPEGLYIVSSNFGNLDIAKTVDSELALVMFDFGWLGLIGFGSLIFVLLKSSRLNTAFGQSALLITASGLYLALHSWTGLGAAWFLMIGLSASSKSRFSENRVEASFPVPRIREKSVSATPWKRD